MTPLMSEWMWQKTLTIPGLSKRTDFDDPFGNLPRSNEAAFDRENTLWKIESPFGNSTWDPLAIARTCGTKVNPS